MPSGILTETTSAHVAVSSEGLHYFFWFPHEHPSVCEWHGVEVATYLHSVWFTSIQIYLFVCDG